MANSFGVNSMKQYSTLHNDLQLILDHTILKCAVDFSLVEGYRPPEKQFEYFKKGRKQQPDGSWVVANKKEVITNIDGYKVKGKHNYNPSIAVDIAVYVPNRPYIICMVSKGTEQLAQVRMKEVSQLIYDNVSSAKSAPVDN